jgi:hypothetical protein
MASGSVRCPPAAETAADGPADEVKVLEGTRICAGIEREEQGCRRGVDDIAAVGIGRCDRTVGFGACSIGDI